MMTMAFSGLLLRERVLGFFDFQRMSRLRIGELVELDLSASLLEITHHHPISEDTLRF